MKTQESFAQGVLPAILALPSSQPPANSAADRRPFEGENLRYYPERRCIAPIWAWSSAGQNCGSKGTSCRFRSSTDPLSVISGEVFALLSLATFMERADDWRA